MSAPYRIASEELYAPIRSDPRAKGRATMFGHRWEPGQATIVAMKETAKATSGEHGTFRALYAYAADVRPDGGASAFRTEMDEPFDIPAWFTPGVGDALPVECDPRRGKAKFDMARLKSAMSAQASAAKDEEIAQFDAALRAAPASRTPASATPSAATPGDPLDRLQELAELHDRATLTDAEFAAAKAKILGES
jgi:hypothetical protein